MAASAWVLDSPRWSPRYLGKNAEGSQDSENQRAPGPGDNG